MKKITLFTLMFLAFTWLGQAQITTFPWNEGFEEATFPPTGWTHVQTNATETWTTYTLDTHSGAQAASCEYDDNVQAQDEVLMTPVIDLSSLTVPELSFWFNMSYYWAIDPNNNYDIKVQATTDGGTTTTDLWSEADYGVFNSWTWYEVKLNLAAYASTANFQLIFRYEGTDGAQAILDDISIQDRPTAAPGCASNLVPADAGTLSVTAAGEGVLSWDATTITDGYHVYLGTTSGTYTTTVDVTDTEYTTTGLTIGTTYFWKVEPFNTVGSAAGCVEQSFTTEAYAVPNCAENPVPADAATAVAIESGRTVVLSWDAPSTGPTPTSYTIELGTVSGTYTIGPATILGTSIPFSGVSENTTYYWRVTPNNGDVSASSCTEWSFTTGAFPAPPANDTCAGAINLPVDANACVRATLVDNSFATDSGEATPSCAANDNVPDLWYTLTVPTSGAVTINTSAVTGSNFDDSVMAVYSGTCTGLTEVDCNDDSSASDFFSELLLTGQTPGETLYVRVTGYSASQNDTFNICAFDPNASSVANNQIAGFEFYPNPVNNTLNLSAQDQIENVNIYNVTGQEVINIQPNKVQAQVDMSQLRNGIYFVKAQINGQVTAFKVVKK